MSTENEIPVKPKIFFTSDLHLGHSNIIKYCDRPFKVQNEMNEVIIKNYNDLVKPEDTVYFLGDIAFMSNVKAAWMVNRLNGTKILVRGNHDKNHNKMKTFGFVDSSHELTINTDYGTIYMRHVPNETYQEGLHFCGHVHTKWRFNRNIVNVGVDVWDFKPVLLEDIINEYNKYRDHGGYPALTR